LSCVSAFLQSVFGWMHVGREDTWKKDGDEKMFVIAGLGNPRKEYENTRHNIGFDVIDMLAKRHNINVTENKHKALIGKGYIGGYKVILVKPLTFMNLSGESIREVLDYYKVDAQEELIVISDDISLEPGYLRIRKKGSAGGHNGLKNIIQHLGHDKFCRVRMGVGQKPDGYDLADYVLGHFGAKERKDVDLAGAAACDAIELIMADGPDAAMNRFNKKNHAAEA